jgi:antirestriction protein
MPIVGYSVYVNTAYYETYEDLGDALALKKRYDAFNEVDILPMVKEDKMLDIFLTDLQSYNEGDLVGTWLTLPCKEYELNLALNTILCEGEVISGSEDHEEYFITDWDWNELHLFEIDEYEDIYTLNSSLQQLETLPSYQLKAISFLLSESITLDIEDAINRSEDVIIHEAQSLEDVAYHLIQECYNIHELSPLIANHIDYEGIARELEYDGNYTELVGDVYEYIG